MKKILILYYSQAGQTKKAVQSFIEGASIESQVDVCEVHTVETYAFPWKMKNFFRVFPECVNEKKIELKPLSVSSFEGYDLIVLAYQVWFLSPSLPMQSLLKDPDFIKKIQGKKVIGITTCRNLWMAATLRVKALIEKCGSQYLSQFTLCDLSPAWASFITTPRWMLTGKKNAFFIFPEAGIPENDFLKAKDWGGSVSSLLKLNRIEEIKSQSNDDRDALVIMEKIGRSVFEFWAKIIGTIAPEMNWKRDVLLFIFRIQLILLILILTPMVMISQCLFSTFLKKIAFAYRQRLVYRGN